MNVTWPEPGGTVAVPGLGNIKQIGKHIRIVVHAVAVQVPAALAHVGVAELYPVLAGVHITVNIEALAF